MKPILALAASLVVLMPSLARADDKAYAILKEVRLRMSKTTTYSANILVSQNSQKPRIRFFLQRPDRYRLEFTEAGVTRTMVLRGNEAALLRNGKIEPISSTEVRQLVNTLNYMVSASFDKVTNEPLTATYITQKILDEKTVVDVIDITSTKTKGTIRFYIDNNSLLRKVVSPSGSNGTTMLFADVILDEPIPKSKFSLK